MLIIMVKNAKAFLIGMAGAARRSAIGVCHDGLLVGLICIGAAVSSAHSQVPKPHEPSALTEHFMELCVDEVGIAQKLPGSDVETSSAPLQFKQYAEQAISSRIVKIGDRYAMRVQSPARADPVHTVIIRCALTGTGSFADEVRKLSEKLSASSQINKTAAGFDFASVRLGLATYLVFVEADGWVSIFRLDVMMRNIDPKYLKKGAKPVPMPPVQ